MAPTRSRSPPNNRHDRWVIFIFLCCTKGIFTAKLTGFNCQEVMGVKYRPSLCTIEHELVIQQNMSVSIIIDTVQYSIRCQTLV